MSRPFSYILGWSIWLMGWLGTCHSLQAQTTIYSESFGTWTNGAPLSWTVAGPGWLPADSLPAASRPALTGCDFGGSYLRFPSATISQPQSSSLISPALNLSSYLGTSLQIQLCLINPGPAVGEGDGISLHVSKDNGGGWVLLETDTSWYGAWSTLSIPLPDSLLSAQFRIRIDGIGYSALLDPGIDHVRVVNPAPPCFAQNTTISATLSEFVCRDNVPDPVQFSNSGSGAASYVYILTDALDRIIQVLPQATVDLNALPEDEYRVYGISYFGALVAPVNQPIQSVSATGCAILSLNFLELQVVSLNGTLQVLSDYNGFAVSASEAHDGAAKVQVEGGSGLYQYLWSSSPSVNADSVNDLSGGQQMITVSDSLTGCQWVDTFSLSMPDPLRIGLSITSQVVCRDDTNGGLTAVISGGVPGYAYTWRHDPALDTLSLDNLSPGWYVLEVTDLNGASTTDSIRLGNPPLLQVQVANLKHACPGFNDGAVILGTSGGVGDYWIEWDNGLLGNVLAGLRPGEYTATVTDGRGCELAKTVVIEQASQPEIVPLASDPTCFGEENGRIELMVVAGREPVFHSWQTGDTGRVVSDLMPGNYQVFSTDANGCRDTSLIRLNSPSPLRLSIQTTPDGGSSTGSVAVNVTGGQAPYSAEWSFGDSTLQPIGVAAGTYGVVIEDANGCTIEQQVIVPLNQTPDCLATNLGFSPNGDGINDVWELPCLAAYGNHEIQVVNRWGQRVLSTTQYDQGWDGRSRGTHLPSGTYYYLIRLEEDGIWHEYKGTLSLVR